jgi:hypothetical protein
VILSVAPASVFASFVLSMLGVQENIVMPAPVVLEPDRGTEDVAALR